LTISLQSVVSYPNDNLVNATNIISLPYTTTQSMTGTTLEINEYDGYSGSVWFKYTPSSNTTLDINTLGSDFYPGLSVWIGTAHPLTQIGAGERLSILAIAGTTYYIRGAGTSIGNLTLNVQSVTLLQTMI